MTRPPLMEPEAVAIAFARIADRIQKRTGCTRLAGRGYQVLY